MKYFNLIIILTFVFLLLSCKTAPDVKDIELLVEELIETELITELTDEEIEAEKDEIPETLHAEEIVYTDQFLAEEDELAASVLAAASMLAAEVSEPVSLEEISAAAQLPQEQIQQTQPQQQPLTQTQTAQLQEEQPSAQTMLPDLITEETADAINDTDTAETAIPNTIIERVFPSSPAARIEPLYQLGAMPQLGDIIFSRIVHLTAGQILEIPFRGNGWVYLGETSSRRGVVYNSRRNDPEGVSFIFNIESTGTFILKFFREDFLRGYILNDYVQVIASEAPAASTGLFNPSLERSRIVAQPRWPSAVEEAEIQSLTNRGTSGVRPRTETPVFTPGTVSPSQETPLSATQTAPQAAAQTGTAASTQPATPRTAQPVTPEVTAPPVTPQATSPDAAAQAASQAAVQTAAQTALQVTPQMTPPEVSSAVVSEMQNRIPPDQLLQRAKETFDQGDTAAAIALLDQYMEYYPGGNDELYWLYGQFYEANTPSRNILLSLSYYRRLVNEFPQSRRLTDARRRIAYLERFYITIQ